jgi:hypothetical protein
MSARSGSIRLPVLDAAPSEPPRQESLLDKMLREQHDLSAVERFSQFHDEVHEPLQEKYYRSLMPDEGIRQGPANGNRQASR